MKLYIFNPDADLALANDTPNYMPPAHVVRMQADLALLPAWFASEGSAVLASSAYNHDFLRRMQQLFHLPVQPVTEPELPSLSLVEPEPWGWNRALHRRLLRAGVPPSSLPDEEWLARYRRLASRETDVQLLRRLADEGFLGAEAEVLTTPDDCRRYVGLHPRCVFKMPWSGSGKGLQWCYEGFTEVAARWCARALKEQGCLVASPLYNKVSDLAFEFFSDGRGDVSYVGCSCFDTNPKGAYQGNLLLPPESIDRHLSDLGIDPAEAERLRLLLCRLLAGQYAPHYRGYLGVDLMVCRAADGQSTWLHPCVEVNLRMNMGVLACLLGERYLAPGVAGRYELKFFATNAELQARAAELASRFPLRVEQGRVAGGFLPLVPVTPHSLYLAYLLVR